MNHSQINAQRFDGHHCVMVSQNVLRINSRCRTRRLSRSGGADLYDTLQQIHELYQADPKNFLRKSAQYGGLLQEALLPIITTAYLAGYRDMTAALGVEDGFSPAILARVGHAAQLRTDVAARLMTGTTAERVEMGQQTGNFLDAWLFSKERATRAATFEGVRGYTQAGQSALRASSGRRGPFQSAVWSKVWELGSNHDRDDICVVGDTPVQAHGLNRAFRRMYTGRLVELVFSDGHKLTGTPNHPVLTTTGWRPLEQIHNGDRCVTGDALKRIGVVADNFYDVEASAEHIFRTHAGAAATTPTSATDFHGDGIGSNVHEVACPTGPLNQFLRHSLGKSGLNNLQCNFLGRALRSGALGAGMDIGLLGSQGLSFALAGGLPARSHGLPLFGAAQRVSRPIQATGDRDAGDTCTFGDLSTRQLLRKIQADHHLGGHAGFVTCASERHFWDTVPVYNLTTRHGYFLADNIVTHNCDDNADSGPIPVAEEFPSGDMTAPAHPNCECSVYYVRT